MSEHEERLQVLFGMLVKAYSGGETAAWGKGYAHGLFNAFVVMSGDDEDVVTEELYEAIDAANQSSHDEMVDDMERRDPHDR